MELPGDYIIPEEKLELTECVMCIVCSTLILNEVKQVCNTPHSRTTCKECIYKQWTIANTRHCPICRADVTEPPRMTDISREIIRGALHVPCPNRAEVGGIYVGCSHYTSLKTMKNHLEICQHTMVTCQFEDRGCLKKVPRAYSEEHVAECGWKPASCPFAKNGCPMTNTETWRLNNHTPNCKWDGVLGHRFTGIMGLPIASNKDRIKKTGVFPRKIQVQSAFFSVTTNAKDYEKLLTSIMITLLSDEESHGLRHLTEEEALDILRQAATETNVWLSGPDSGADEEPEHEEEEHVELPLDVDDLDAVEELLRDSDAEVLYESENESMEAVEDEVQTEVLRDDHNNQNVMEEGALEIRGGAAALQGPAHVPPTHALSDAENTAGSHMSTPGEGIARPHAQETDPQVQGAAAQAIHQLEINSLDEMVEYIKQQGGNYNSLDLSEREAAFQREMMANSNGHGQIRWMAQDTDRLNRQNKEYTAEGDNCKICAETGTAIFPRGTQVKHRHSSSRLYNLREDALEGKISCGHCAQRRHLLRPTFRRRVILTSSSLDRGFTEIRDELQDNYAGMDGHVDLVSVPGGSLKQLAHAILVELKGSDEPIDLAVYGGLNDAMNLPYWLDENGQVELDSEALKDLYRTLALLSAELVNSGNKNTLRMCQVKCPPRIHSMGTGAMKAWRMVNLAIRTCNQTWAEMWGISTPKHMNFQSFALTKKRDGSVNCTYSSYREPQISRKLHLIPRYKLAFCIKISRVWGIKPVPEGYYPAAIINNNQ